jgi:hypothetical protein
MQPNQDLESSPPYWYATASASPIGGGDLVAKLDTEFQAAVKVNDAQTIGRMLHENKVLATPRHHDCLSPTGVNGH